MRIALAVNPSTAKASNASSASKSSNNSNYATSSEPALPAPAAPIDLRRSVAAGGENAPSFADALSGLEATIAPADFAALADAQPPEAEGEKTEGAAADATDAAGAAAPAPAPTIPAMPAMEMSCALPVAAPLAMSFAAFAVAAAPGSRANEAKAAPLATDAAAVAATPVAATTPHRVADVADPATLRAPAAADDSARAFAVPVAVPEPVAPAAPAAARPKAPAEEGAVGEAKPAAASPAAVDLAAVSAPSPLRAPAADAAYAAPALKLPAATPEQWRSQLLEALGERIRVEVGKRGEQAVIRLDPPMLGSVEIAIRHQGGVLQVQLSASHDEVLRQLQHIGESLRQDLSQRQYTDVSVQVFAGSRDGDGRQRPQGQPEERQPGRALAEADAEQTPSAFAFSSNGTDTA
jgi:flagellar hook-length control protein FliK